MNEIKLTETTVIRFEIEENGRDTKIQINYQHEA